MSDWFYVKEGQRVGPVAEEEFRRLAAAGTIQGADQVWRQGLEGWMAAGAVPGLVLGAPQAGAAPPEISGTSLDYAGFRIRAAARMIDAAACFVVGLGAGMAAGIALVILNMMGRAPANWLAIVKAPGLWSPVLGILAMTFYHGLAEGVGGASLGKLVCGLRVIKDDGGPAGVGAGFIRNLGFFIDSLFFGLVGWSRMKKSARLQRYGDGWAGTAVVTSASLPAAAKRSALEIGGALAFGAFAAFAVETAGTVAKVLLAF